MYIAFQFHESTAHKLFKYENAYNHLQDWHEMSRNPSWLQVWMMVHMTISRPSSMNRCYGSLLGGNGSRNNKVQYI